MTIENDSDLDPQETQEWLEALEAVLEEEGLQRAHDLLGALQDKARAAPIPRISTPFRSTRKNTRPAIPAWNGGFVR